MVVSMANWAPWCNGNPSATTSKRLVSLGCPEEGGPCRESTRWWTPWRLLLYTRAAADSRANPLRPNTPTCAQAVRWWPRESSGRPHWQLREDGGKGSQRRRRINTLNKEESILNSRLTGKHVNGTPDMGPPCDQIKACSGGERRGQMVVLTKCACTASVASCCHP